MSANRCDQCFNAVMVCEGKHEVSDGEREKQVTDRGADGEREKKKVQCQFFDFQIGPHSPT